MPNVDDLRGLWQRSLIAWPDGRRDSETRVKWLQGVSAYIDIRQPEPIRDFTRARGLDWMTMDDCLWLAHQEGFAGTFTFDDSYFEWAPEIDFQPKSIYSDAGTLHWDGDVLVEEGRDIAYVEHWHRDPVLVNIPAVAVSLREANSGRKGALLRVGQHFMFARDRLVIPPERKLLAECVATATLEDARALVDCEISFGHVERRDFCITSSTLPYRIGDILGQKMDGDTLITMDRAANGETITRYWQIVGQEGELLNLNLFAQ